MGASDPRPPSSYAIAIRDGTPVLVRIEDKGGRVVELVPEDDQPPADELLAMVEAQGGIFEPHGLFRYDPVLATSGIKNCWRCGALWQVRGYCRDPDFVPAKCPRCQAPYRGPNPSKPL